LYKATPAKSKGKPAIFGKKENEKLGPLLCYSLLIKGLPVVPQQFWEYLSICNKRSTWDFSECHRGSF